MLVPAPKGFALCSAATPVVASLLASMFGALGARTKTSLKTTCEHFETPNKGRRHGRSRSPPLSVSSVPSCSSSSSGRGRGSNPQDSETKLRHPSSAAAAAAVRGSFDLRRLGKRARSCSRSAEPVREHVARKARQAQKHKEVYCKRCESSSLEQDRCLNMSHVCLPARLCTLLRVTLCRTECLRIYPLACVLLCLYEIMEFESIFVSLHRVSCHVTSCHRALVSECPWSAACSNGSACMFQRVFALLCVCVGNWDSVVWCLCVCVCVVCLVRVSCDACVLCVRMCVYRACVMCVHVGVRRHAQ